MLLNDKKIKSLVKKTQKKCEQKAKMKEELKNKLNQNKALLLNTSSELVEESEIFNEMKKSAFSE